MTPSWHVLALAGHDLRPPAASSFAPEVDRALLLVAWFIVFLSVVSAGGLVLLALARRDPAGPHGAGARAARKTARIVGAATLVLVAAFFVQGALAWADMQTIPRGAFLVRVGVGEKGFEFQYPSGFVADELHLGIDRAVKLDFAGAPEPYTFSVPAFRLQVAVDAETPRASWVQPTLAGEFAARSIARPRASKLDLSATIVVHPEGGFDKWYQDVSGPPLDLPPIELGLRSYQMRGCTQCHTTDGTKLVGPTFKGFLTREHRLKDGTVVEPSDAYIAESIVDSAAKIVEGYEPVMPSFRGRLHELEVAGLVAYIKSLP